MKILQKLARGKIFWPILIVVFFVVLAGRTLIFQEGYFNMHDDLQMMRQLEMEKCIIDNQIPCRWIPDMGYGFGFPLFNFYPPLPYLIGEIFRLAGFSFVGTAKLLFALSFIVSGITMYLLAKEFFGKLGGVVSSIFYIWAPYHSVDVYVRGAMNEAWALAWFPLILWAGYRLILRGGLWIVVLALSWTALLTSHNLMVLIFAPVFAGWCLLWLWRSKNLVSSIKYLVSSGLLAFGLAAFFTLPALVEQKYVQVNTLVVGYYEYIAHFVNINQLLFSRFWGYGASVWGETDGMPFQIGHVHWILSLVIIVASVHLYFKSNKSKGLLIIGYFFLVGWFSLFMAHVRSTPIWQLFPPLKFVQFPWRFLTLSTLSFSFIAGSVAIFLKPFDRLRVIIPSFLIILLVIINWNYFLPVGGKMGPLTDTEKFSGAAWDLQRTAGIFDYLPKGARENPKEPPQSLAEIISGGGSISGEEQGTNWAKFNVAVSSRQSVVRVNIFDFPDWRVYLDGQRIEKFIPKDEKWGRMYINAPQGEHKVYLKLYNTPIRTVGNTISLVFWLGLLTFPLWRQKMLQFKRGR